MCVCVRACVRVRVCVRVRACECVFMGPCIIFARPCFLQLYMYKHVDNYDFE